MNDNINRRNFIKTGALGSAGLLIGSSLAAGTAGYFSQPMMHNKGIGGIVPVSLIEDVNLLLLRFGGFKGDTEFALASDLHNRPAPSGNKGRIASVLPVLDKKLIQLLNIIRNDKELPNRVAKIAIAFGWICNNSGIRYIKPVYGINPSDGEAREIQTYHDAQLIKEMSGLDTSVQIKEEDLASLFHEILPRSLTRVHTLIPAEDGPEWVNRITAWRKDNKAYLQNLARVMVQPEKDKKLKYVDNPNFYAPDDSIILSCRNLKIGIDVKPENIKLGADEAVNGSLYAKALGEAYTHIIYANEYLNGNIKESELESKLF